MEKILIGTIVVLWGSIVSLVIYIKVMHQQTRKDNKEVTQVIVENTREKQHLAQSNSELAGAIKDLPNQIVQSLLANGFKRK